MKFFFNNKNNDTKNEINNKSVSNKEELLAPEEAWKILGDKMKMARENPSTKNMENLLEPITVVKKVSNG